MTEVLFRDVFDNAPDPTVVVDTQGMVVYANFRIADVFGYAPRELIGESVETLLPERYAQSHQLMRRRYVDNPVPRPMGSRPTLFGRHKDGTEFPVDVSLSPVRSENGLLIASSIRDVSQRVSLEQDLRRAIDESEQANAAKSRFLSMAGHDLRQPVQTLALNSEMLIGMLEDNREAMSVLSRQRNALSQMGRLLDALMEISKLESGNLVLRKELVSMAQVLLELKPRFLEAANAKGLTLTIEEWNGTIRTDPILFDELLNNLVSNAIRYTRVGRVLVRCAPRDEFIVIDVVDTGIGIPPDQLTDIFAEFHQVEPGGESAADRGFGLGLSIVIRIVDLLGYELEVDSKPGEGSRFSVVIPYSGGD